VGGFQKKRISLLYGRRESTTSTRNPLAMLRYYIENQTSCTLTFYLRPFHVSTRGTDCPARKWSGWDDLETRKREESGERRNPRHRGRQRLTPKKKKARSSVIPDGCPSTGKERKAAGGQKRNRFTSPPFRKQNPLKGRSVTIKNDRKVVWARRQSFGQGKRAQTILLERITRVLGGLPLKNS